MSSARNHFLAVALTLLLVSLAAMAADGGKDAANKATTATATPAAPEPSAVAAPDPLIQLLVNKGILSSAEADSLAGAPPAEQRDRLVQLLQAKGVLSAADVSALSVRPSDSSSSSTGLGSAPAATLAVASPAQGGGAMGTGVIPAVMPIRPLTVGKPPELVPAFKIGDIGVRPYGFVKASSVYDSSSPYGNDFPLPGFNPITNGPDALSEYHVKVRALRLGANFEWKDIAPDVTLTGKVEISFESMFNRVSNRNVSAIDSPTPYLRLGYARIDWAATDATSLFSEFGQDWTPFGSSTLPDLFESTGMGLGFGTLYQRSPQFRFGVNHNFGTDRNFSIQPEFAIVLPGYGNLPADLTVQGGPLAGTPVANNEGVANQLAYGERQGVDSARPEIQARMVFQFQLDKAPGVAPAQIIFSGVDGDRSVVVLANQVPAFFAPAFRTGVRKDSTRMGWTAEAQLPTRWFTLTGKYYNGSDLRFYQAGEFFSEFNDTTGLHNTATAQSIDAASTLVFGCLGAFPGVAPCVTGAPVVANQLPPRSQGGFVNLGLPLSRWAGANPEGRNAGWVMYLHYGYDQVLARDVRRLGGGREKSDLMAGTLQYKLNKYVSFVMEESLYRTRALPLTSTGLFPSFAGRPMREWRDLRNEIGTIFTF